MKLSVSSVGSSPLQPSWPSSSQDAGRHFQYPRSDRAHCNAAGRGGRRREGGTFSILGRIEPTATLAWVALAAGLLPFQYPRSDRAHCNPGRKASTGGATTFFQYPRSDRAHCNLPPDEREVRLTSNPFSILGRIEPTATPIASRTNDRFPKLSVSSVGSSPLQPPSPCKRLGPPARLSVSSVGSSPLQQVRLGAPAWAIRTFSILGRIEPTATPEPGLHPAPRLFPFSILGRIEPTATEHPPAQADQVHHFFQYPRSDRAHCNAPIGATS